jgi:hypothetical protein
MFLTFQVTASQEIAPSSRPKVLEMTRRKMGVAVATGSESSSGTAGQ